MVKGNLCVLLLFFALVDSEDVTITPVSAEFSHGDLNINKETGEELCTYTISIPHGCSKYEEMEQRLDRLTREVAALQGQMQRQLEDLYADLQSLSLALVVQDYSRSSNTPKSYRDCSKIYQSNSDMKSGAYLLQPWDSPQPFYAYCEVNDSDVWTVIQRRLDGTVNFYKEWEAYKAGFGNRTGEFWLGNDNIYYLTSQAHYKLRIELEDWANETRYAEYDRFWIGSQSEKYRLHLGEYSGNAGDAFSYHDNERFTTKDKDYDKNSKSNCAVLTGGGWWYDNCQQSNLNGMYYEGGVYEARSNDGIQWTKWKSSFYSLKTVTMKIQAVY
ncbi:fibrinogen-like protein 1 [Ptychodera flava]|uniref:fibrinogen-like protein 1 n=1 Tax=Ptychodera flava TaxID=63121 RepID=UPI003969E6F1